jgi:hypothetical protein
MTSPVSRALRRCLAALATVALLAPALNLSGTSSAATAPTTAAGQVVLLNDTTPTSDQWNLAAVEVRP